jgi:hypothetical protein
VRDSLQTIFLAVFASSGFWAFIQYLLSRHDGTTKELQAISAHVAQLAKKVDGNVAVLARTHILRFDDELLNGVVHSKEYFRQQMDDIDTYENFCKAHPDFRNSYTTIASEHIRDTYKKLLDKREFSVEGGNHAE